MLKKCCEGADVLRRCGGAEKVRRCGDAEKVWRRRDSEKVQVQICTSPLVQTVVSFSSF
jgi:hypothetical protein